MIRRLRSRSRQPSRRLVASISSVCAIAILGGCRNDLAGPANEISFRTQPRSSSVGAVLAPVQIALFDVFGNPTSGRVTVSINDNRCGARLGGTLTRDAVDGVATFDDLTIDVPESSYRLEARVDRDTIVSVPFEIAGHIGQFLRVTTTLCSKPNDQRDAESLAYLPDDDQFWLGDDDLPSIYHVERQSGSYLGRLDTAAFVAAFPELTLCDDGDGNPATSCSYLSELEILTYDEASGFLYILNTVNDSLTNPPVDRPAIFRLRKESCTGCVTFESWQELPPGHFYTAAATINSELYLAVGESVYAYDYDTNQLMVEDQNGSPLPPAYRSRSTITGLAFDGTSLWVLTSHDLHKAQWSSGTELFKENLANFGIALPKGVEVVGTTVYVVDGDEPHRIYAFRE